MCPQLRRQDKDVATLPPSAVAVRGPTALPLLGPALRAEGLLGLCHGQPGQRRNDDNDEGRGRRLHPDGPFHRFHHVPLRLPVSPQGRPVLRPRSVRGCPTAPFALSSFLSVFVQRSSREKGRFEWQDDGPTRRVSHDHLNPTLPYSRPTAAMVFYQRGISSLKNKCGVF